MNYVGRVYNYWSSISICVITFVPRHRGGRGGGAGGQSTARRNAKGGGSATEPFNGEIYGGEGPGVANLRTKFQLLHDSGTWRRKIGERTLRYNRETLMSHTWTPICIFIPPRRRTGRNIRLADSTELGPRKGAKLWKCIDWLAKLSQPDYKQPRKPNWCCIYIPESCKLLLVDNIQAQLAKIIHRSCTSVFPASPSLVNNFAIFNRRKWILRNRWWWCGAWWW